MKKFLIIFGAIVLFIFIIAATYIGINIGLNVTGLSKIISSVIGIVCVIGLTASRSK